MKTPIKKDELEEYYIFAVHWLSDFDFFENELNFFGKILQNNIIFSTQDQYLGYHLEYQVKLNEIKTDERIIRNSILDHMKQLVQLFKNSTPDRTQEIKDAHEVLRGKVANFVTRYRLYKDQLYAIAKQSTETLTSDIISKS